MDLWEVVDSNGFYWSDPSDWLMGSKDNLGLCSCGTQADSADSAGLCAALCVASGHAARESAVRSLPDCASRVFLHILAESELAEHRFGMFEAAPRGRRAVKRMVCGRIGAREALESLWPDRWSLPSEAGCGSVLRAVEVLDDAVSMRFGAASKALSDALGQDPGPVAELLGGLLFRRKLADAEGFPTSKGERFAMEWAEGVASGRVVPSEGVWEVYEEMRLAGGVAAVAAGRPKGRRACP